MKTNFPVKIIMSVTKNDDTHWAHDAVATLNQRYMTLIYRHNNTVWPVGTHYFDDNLS